MRTKTKASLLTDQLEGHINNLTDLAEMLLGHYQLKSRGITLTTIEPEQFAKEVLDNMQEAIGMLRQPIYELFDLVNAERLERI